MTAPLHHSLTHHCQQIHNQGTGLSKCQASSVSPWHLVNLCH
jgi:hypothetical protein